MPTGFHAVPDWTFWENQGAAVAVADLDGDGHADLVVLTVDDPPGQNRGLYRVGRTLDAAGAVAGGWTGWLEVPDWFSWANQGCGVAVVDRGATRDLVVFLVDNPGQQNRGVYRLGRDLRADGVVTGGWTPWTDVPEWTFWENAGAGIAVADLGDGGADLVVFTVDDPVGQNRGLYRVGHGLNGDGVVTGGLVGLAGRARLVLVGEPGRRRRRGRPGRDAATSSSSPSTTRRARTRPSTGSPANVDVRGAPGGRVVAVARGAELVPVGEPGRRDRRVDGRRRPEPDRPDGRRAARAERRALHPAPARRGPGDARALGAAAVLRRRCWPSTPPRCPAGR